MDTTLLTGYARCSTDEQDLSAQTEALLAMGVPAERIYTDKGLTGTNRNRPRARPSISCCAGRRHPGRPETGPAGPFRT